MRQKEQVVKELKDDLEALRKGWRMGYADPKNWEAFVIDKLADIYCRLEIIETEFRTFEQKLLETGAKLS